MSDLTTLAAIVPKPAPPSLGMMVALPNIAVCGRMGAGKTTIVDFLVDKFKYEKAGFADAIYDVAERIWGPAARMDRGKLIDVGKKVREIDEHAWVDALDRELDTYITDSPLVVDNLRFPNEYWMLKRRGFVIVRVAADEEKRVDRLQRTGKLDSLDQLQDETETALDGYASDYVLTNQGEIEDLHTQVLEAIWKEANRS